MKGLTDDRGNLTLELVDIVEANDAIRAERKQAPSIVFWENVEGVLRDRTNAFGCLLASLVGAPDEIKLRGKWPLAGLARGPKRNVAWRILDAKFFGLPQQRRRLYLVAGGKDFAPENVLFELDDQEDVPNYQDGTIRFQKENNNFTVFRAYTDCLYSAYGTKWNGNAAAYNGSLFVVQNNRIRRLTPLECERLMGFPDNYTYLEKVKPTARYQAIGNSWSVPVVRWLGNKISNLVQVEDSALEINIPDDRLVYKNKDIEIFGVGGEPFWISPNVYLNSSARPSHASLGNMKDILEICAEEKFYLTPVGCKGILRRKSERNKRINPDLETTLARIASEWSDEDIEAISRIQPRGKHSQSLCGD